MRRPLIILIPVIVLCLFVACGNTATISTPAPETSVIPAETFSPGFSTEKQQYCAPWVTDVVDQAIDDGKIHYYFMSGKGLIADPDGKDPQKWGDSTLIVFPNGQTMLIDMGVNKYNPILVENLKRMGITRLDYLLISHPHGDHCWGLILKDNFLNYIQVGTVLWNGALFGLAERIQTSCANYGVPMQILKRGDTMHFGEVTMRVVWPMEGVAGIDPGATEDENNTSIVARFSYKNHASLFVGDLYESGEAKIVDLFSDELQADLLKVPHHGYETSSSTLFAFKVRPELAVAMGTYCAPIENRYKSIGSDFLSDRLHGYIHVSSDGDQMTVEHQ